MFHCCEGKLPREESAEGPVMIERPDSSEVPADLPQEEAQIVLEKEVTAPKGPEARAPFECVINGQEAWGMSIESWSDFLEVVTIKDKGRIATYNEKQDEINKEERPGSEHKLIQVSDLIVQVNAETQIAGMKAILQDQAQTSVRLSVMPSFRTTIKVGRYGATPWGISVAATENQKRLVINGSPKKGSPTYIFNESADATPFGIKFALRDLIVSINGVTGKASDMMDVLKDASVNTIEIEVLRPKTASE